MTGGISFFHITAQTEVYDVRRDEWTTVAPLPRRLHHVALAACDGRIFASGGYTTLAFGHDEEATLWQYEALTDRWITEAALPHPLGEHAMACLNQQLYLVGGREQAGVTAAIWAYDLAKRSWSQSSTSLSTQPTRFGPSGTRLGNWPAFSSRAMCWGEYNTSSLT